MFICREESKLLDFDVERWGEFDRFELLVDHSCQDDLLFSWGDLEYLPVTLPLEVLLQFEVTIREIAK